VTAGQIKKYSQRQVDVLNLKTGRMETADFRTLVEQAQHPDLFYAVSVDRDGHLSPPLFKTQGLIAGDLCITFENFLEKTSFVRLARKILSKIEAAYGRPVDMEFAWDENKFYVLQCRSLSTRKELERVRIPEDLSRNRVLFTTRSGVSNCMVTNVEYVVYVNPRAYDLLPTFQEKMEIAGVVNALNKALAEKRFALMGPGRWGSNDINLGVKVTYSNINKARLLVEVAFAKEGYTPEVSYGTHFFQDLVEADIVIVPLFPDDPGVILNEPFLLDSENLLARVAPEVKDCEGIVRVIHVPSACGGDFLQVYLDTDSQRGVGFFGPKEAEG
jgi:hypothetical protein